jgi:hypothetical protein
MKLKDYFSSQQGIAILSTANARGVVNAAIYAPPRMVDDECLALIMRERLTYKNLQENPHAAYLFVESHPGYKGVRLILKKLREDDDPELIAEMTRRSLCPAEDRTRGPKHVVYFQIEKALSLIGADELSL